MDHEILEEPDINEELISPSKKRKKIVRWAGTLLTGLVLGIFSAWSFAQGNLMVGFAAELDRPLEHDQLSGLYEEFQCPCCEQHIGECTCPLAEERRDIISEMSILGASRRDVYQFMLLHDGPGAFFNQELAAEVGTWLEEILPAERAIISIEPLEIDMGTVSMAQGLVSERFKLKNIGLVDLAITNLATSCMCTTVALETSGGVGPTFGAHLDENLVGWTATLAPNEEAALIVTFDPNAHGPDAVGQLRRVITVSSNDPLQPSTEVEVVVNVER